MRLVLKAVLQLLVLLYMLLFGLPRPSTILLQLPPAIPTMLVCWLAAKWHRAKLVFDWHNFAYTLMAINMGRRHPLVGGRACVLAALGRVSRCSAHTRYTYCGEAAGRAGRQLRQTMVSRKKVQGRVGGCRTSSEGSSEGSRLFLGVSSMMPAEF